MGEHPELPSMDPGEMLAVVQHMEQRLSAPSGSIARLFTDDDWSFVIKAHAMLEGAVSILLWTHIDGRLRDPFERLDLGAERSGKLSFAKALNLLTPQERGFISYLSELRNRLAHDPKYLAFALDAHVAGMDKNQRGKFATLLSSMVAPEHQASWADLARRTPRFALLAAVVRLLLSITMAVDRRALEAREEIEQINARIAAAQADMDALQREMDRESQQGEGN